MTPRSRPPTRRARARAALAATVLPWLLAACSLVSTTPPSPTPADFPGLATIFGQHGLRIADVESGDAGCPDPTLAPTAIRFTVRGLDQADPVPVYLYIFRNREVYERRRADVDTCARSYVTDPATFSSMEASPFVLAGQGPWAPDFSAEIRAALVEAAGTGG